MAYKEVYYNEEGTDSLPIKVEMVSEGEYDLESVITFYTAEQFNIEVNGKAVNVNELMSKVNEYHDTSTPLDGWAYEFPAVDYMSIA